LVDNWEEGAAPRFLSDLFAEQAAIFSRFIFRGFFVSG
jgi:hypothetical protein